MDPGTLYPSKQLGLHIPLASDLNLQQDLHIPLASDPNLQQDLPIPLASDPNLQLGLHTLLTLIDRSQCQLTPLVLQVIDRSQPPDVHTLLDLPLNFEQKPADLSPTTALTKVPQLPNLGGRAGLLRRGIPQTILPTA